MTSERPKEEQLLADETLDDVEPRRETVSLPNADQPPSPRRARDEPDQIGRYSILGLIGRGRMVEVYRARDSQLGRDVAIRLLRSDLRGDPTWATRFEREARAIGALSHPNVLAFHDVGAHEGAAYVVTELLDGTTLRSRLGAPIDVPRALEIGTEIAAGLAAAHEKGIVHRDLTPESVLVTRDGRVKIIDLGLSGCRDEPGDARSDLFSLGAILHEMLSGRPPPAPLPGAVPSAVARLVRRCLAKDPVDRFQSALDLSAELREALTIRESPPPRRRRGWPLAATGAAVLAAAGFLFLRGAAPAPRDAGIDYVRLTFRRGVVDNARFAPDGQTVVYSGSFGTDGSRVYATVGGRRESRALTEPGYSLAAVGRDGDLAVLRGNTLARMSLSGGAPRDVAYGITEADFASNGDLVALRDDVVEAPLGHPLYKSSGSLQSLRVSPAGDRIAFVEHPIARDDAGRVCTVTHGAYACSTDAHWYIMNRVAWAADGDELWFSAIDEGSRGGIYGVGPSFPPRRLLALQLSASIFDVGPRGALVAMNDLGMSAIYRDAAGVLHDLSWLDISVITAISADGTTILLAEGGMGGSSDYEAYLRPTDGGPALGIGTGFPAALSDDKQWAVLFQRRDDRHRLLVVPTRSGAPRELAPGPVQRYDQGNAGFLPGAARIVFTARAAGGWQVFAQDVAGGDPVPLTEEGWQLGRPPLTPDGTSLLVFDRQGRYVLRPLDGGKPRPVPELGDSVRPLGFDADGRGLFVLVVDGPRDGHVNRLDLATGAKTPLYELHASGPLSGVGPFVTPDGRRLVYSEKRRESTLFMVSGLRPQGAGP